MTENQSSHTSPHPAYILERDEPIAELRARAQIFRHRKSGARLLSIQIDDENKVFGVTFRTPPTDSTGLPHILEHAVLGGSQKFPLKDPFFELVKGSLKTFLNAFTSPDKTVYPVASTNLKDFYNLVDVYLDAVFFPLITPHHLDQEGWHYEVANDAGELAYKGVVFNEMKGVYSSPDSLLYRHAQQTLFPDTPYRHDSGGDPAAITNLTYADFKAFHARYYHPSNALLYFYGDDDPQKRLEIADAYLSRFDAQEIDSEIPLQPALAQPRRYTFHYGVDDGSDNARKTMISINWLLPEKNDPNRNMALGVLSYALIGTQASPLRKALVDSGLGEDVQGGLSAGLRQMAFSAGMKNIAAQDADKVEKLVLQTLAEIATTGFENDLLEAAINTIEFSLRENNTGGTPRGLSVMMRALSLWLYGGDPLQAVRYEAPLAWIKQTLAERPDYLQGLIRDLLLNNKHRVTVVLEPDPARNGEMDQEEKERLRTLRGQMTPEQIQAVIANSEALKRRQNQPDPPHLLATLPSLALEDLEPRNRPIPSVEEALGDTTVLLHDLDTSSILYLTLAFEMRHLPQALIPWADLFGQLLTQMGTEREDYVKLSQRIGRKTGGVGASAFVAAVQGRAEPNARFMVSGKATLAQVPDMLAIMRDILLTVKLDNPERLRQIVLRDKSRMESSLIPAGNAYVSTRLRAGFDDAGWANEQMDGVEQLFFLRKLAADIDADFPGVLAQLERVRRALVNRAGLVCNVTVDSTGWQQLRGQLGDFLDQLPGDDTSAINWSPAPLPAVEGLLLPAQVNYVGKAANLYASGYVYHGSLNVISNIVRTGWLLDRIRVQGGAYGASMGFSRAAGVITFTSYRDPNLLATLDVYDGTGAYLNRLDMSQTELTRAIIGAISSFDPYMLPDARGRAAFHRWLAGDTEERLQQIREEILGTTVHRIKEFGDVLDAGLRDARIVVLGAQEAMRQANEARGGNWITTTRVM